MLTANEIAEWNLDGAPPPAQQRLHVEGLVKHFTSRSGLFRRKITSVRAVDAVSLTIHGGETAGISGPPGCGKSTIRRLIMGTSLPDAGTILLDGSAVNRAKLHLIVGGDLTAFHSGHTIEDSIAKALVRQGMTRAHAAAQARLLLQRVSFGSARIGSARRQDLDREESSRATLAAALAANPRLLILDEPFAGLPLARQMELADLLRSIASEFGMTCLLLTREPLVAGLAATHTFAMQNGRLSALTRQAPML